MRKMLTARNNLIEIASISGTGMYGFRWFCGVYRHSKTSQYYIGQGGFRWYDDSTGGNGESYERCSKRRADHVVAAIDADDDDDEMITKHERVIRAIEEPIP